MGTHSRKVPSQGNGAERSPGLPRRKQTRPEEAGARSPDAPVRGPTEQGEPGGGGAAGRVNGGEVAGADPAGGFARPGPGVTAGDAGQGEGAAVRDQRQALAQPGGCLALSQRLAPVQGEVTQTRATVSANSTGQGLRTPPGAEPAALQAEGVDGIEGYGGAALSPLQHLARGLQPPSHHLRIRTGTRKSLPLRPPLKGDGPAAQRHSFFLRLLPWTSSCWERAPW